MTLDRQAIQTLDEHLASLRDMARSPVGAGGAARIRAYALAPDREAWAAIYRMALDPAATLSLWQAVVLTSRDFPSQVALDAAGRQVWDRIPTPAEILRAVEYAVR